MRFSHFNIDGSDYLDSIGDVELIEAVEPSGVQRNYTLTIQRAEQAESPWLGGYSVRPEFLIKFAVDGQQGTGRWRRVRYDSQAASFVSVGDIDFDDRLGD